MVIIEKTKNIITKEKPNADWGIADGELCEEELKAVVGGSVRITSIVAGAYKKA
jgi:hypothetical protein